MKRPSGSTPRWLKKRIFNLKTATQGGNSGKTTEIKLEVRLKKDFPAGSVVTQMNKESVRITFVHRLSVIVRVGFEPAKLS